MHSQLTPISLTQDQEPQNATRSKRSTPKSTEDILLGLRGRIALVGNGTPCRPFGKLIDNYDVVIRFNNYRIDGFEELVGSRTDFRCTTAWKDIEHRPGTIEFSPFRADAPESTYLAAFNETNHRPVLTAEHDIHPLISESTKPSAGLSLIQLFHVVGLQADLFCFDGFKTPHYWSGTATPTTHSRSELDIILSRSHVLVLGETYPYEQLYEFCHTQHSAYDENVGLELVRRLNKSVQGKKVLEFGSGNGGLAAHFEAMGNHVTAFEISPTAFSKIQCSRKVRDTALGLPFLQEKFDLFASVDVLEHLTENDIRLVIREAARLSSELFLSVSTRPSGLLGPNEENLHLTVRPTAWWMDLVSQYFDVTVRPGYGKGQIVLEGTLRCRAGVVIDSPRSVPAEGPLHSRHYLPAEYQFRPQPEYFEDSVTDSTGVVWQPDVYPLAARIARELGAGQLIDVGCGRAKKLMALAKEFHVTGLDFGANLVWCREQYPEGHWLEANFEENTEWPLDMESLHDAVLICSDVIEHLIDPRPLLRQLRRLLEHAKAALISTPERVLTRGAEHQGPPQNLAHTREWGLEEFVQLLRSEGLTLDYAGLTPSNDQGPTRQTLLVVAGNQHGRHYVRESGTMDQQILSWRRRLMALDDPRIISEPAPATPCFAPERVISEFYLSCRNAAHRALEKLPDEPILLIAHSTSLFGLGDQAAAQRCAERAITLHPDYIPARKLLAAILNQSEQGAEAQAHTIRALELEAVAEGRRQARLFSFLDHLPKGELLEGDASQVELREATLNGINDSTLFMHPPAQLRFEVSALEAGKFTSAISIQPEAWHKPKAGGCEFFLFLDGKSVFQKSINPTLVAKDRCWHEVSIEVPSKSSGHHEFILGTRAIGDPPDFRWALWRRPLFRALAPTN